MSVKTVNYNPKPRWLKVDMPSGDDFHDLKKNMKSRGLATVCEEARCPNIGECWAARTATIMILGDTCTRACKFCHVKTGNPQGIINVDEIKNSVEMVAMMALKYLVITSVDRDDLSDHGAGHFAAVVKAIAHHHPDTKVEVLIPDFLGIKEHMNTLATAEPFVIAQNLETVKRLTHPVRDRRAGYQQTLAALKYYKENFSHITTKSSLMVGLGETWQELEEAMDDLREAKVEIITFGQYLQPSRRHLKVAKYYHPKEFEELKKIAYTKGFEFVASGPLVRSSYKAGDYLKHIEEKSGNSSKV